MKDSPEVTETSPEYPRMHEYWVHNLQIMGCLLVVWFLVSFGCGILWVEQLNNLTYKGVSTLCISLGVLCLLSSFIQSYTSHKGEKDTGHVYATIRPVLWGIAFILLANFFGGKGAETVRLGGFQLGFWFAQQGAIYCFVVLIFVYVRLMNKLDHIYQVEEE